MVDSSAILDTSQEETYKMMKGKLVDAKELQLDLEVNQLR